MRSLEFTTIAHRGLRILTPIFPEKMNRLLEALALEDGHALVDIGCGKGAFLLAAARRARIHGTGYDLNPEFLRQAREFASEAPLLGELEFVRSRGEEVALARASLDVAICTGATHALGGLAMTLKCFGTALKPGGCALIGEGYWKKAPDPEYIRFLGGMEEGILDLSSTMSFAQREGFQLMHGMVSSDDEWDYYESSYAMGVRSYCLENPDDIFAIEFSERIDAWNEAYWRWGRDTLGLCWMVLKKQSTATG